MEAGKIYKAISDTMKDIGIVGKNDTNTYDKYKFRGIDAVMNALNPAMIKHGIFVVPTVLESTREERAGSKGTTMMYTILKVKYTFYAEDGSSVESVVVGEAMDRSDKSTNKAMSAAFKYACFQTFCIPTEEMQDADKESPEIGNKVENEDVDPTLLPTKDNKISKAQWDKYQGELDRTGVDETVIFATVGIKSREEMTEAKMLTVLKKFAKTADKGE